MTAMREQSLLRAEGLEAQRGVQQSSGNSQHRRAPKNDGSVTNVLEGVKDRAQVGIARGELKNGQLPSGIFEVRRITLS